MRVFCLSPDDTGDSFFVLEPNADVAIKSFNKLLCRMIYGCAYSAHIGIDVEAQNQVLLQIRDLPEAKLITIARASINLMDVYLGLFLHLSDYPVDGSVFLSKLLPEGIVKVQHGDDASYCRLIANASPMSARSIAITKLSVKKSNEISELLRLSVS